MKWVIFYCSMHDFGTIVSHQVETIEKCVFEACRKFFSIEVENEDSFKKTIRWLNELESDTHENDTLEERMETLSTEFFNGDCILHFHILDND